MHRRKFIFAAAALLALRAESQETATLFVPVIVSTTGQAGSFFTSEIAETNTSKTDATVSYRYTASSGGGSGTVTNPEPLRSGRQRVIPDAIAYLQGLGLAIPTGVNVVGTLQVSFANVAHASGAAVTVRTTTPVPVGAPTGRAGLAYSALQPAGLLAGTAYLAGLRQNGQDRSNVAVQNAGGPGDGPVTLRLTWIPSGGPAGATQTVTLGPGDFMQWAVTAFDPNASAGTVLVERIAGTALYFAYAVINDQINSDGSFVPPLVPRAGGYGLVAGLTLPTVVETGTYETEVIVTNLTGTPVSASLTCQSASFPAGTILVSLGPFEQRVFPNFIQALRDAGVPGIPAAGATITSTVKLTSGSSIGTFALGGRTLNAAPGGGRYGVFTAAQPWKSGPLFGTVLYALRQDGENRTNVAVVNMGDLAANSVQMNYTIYDGDTGMKVTTVTDTVSVPPGGFHQINSFLTKYAPGVKQGWVFASATGYNGIVVYAVVDDGAQPGQRSGDGAVVPMDPYDVGPWEGTWNNQTYATSGGIRRTDLVERMSQRLETTVSLTGNVFGTGAPPTQVFVTDFPQTFGTPALFSGTSPAFGTYSASVGIGSGAVTATASNIPSPNVSGLTFTGAVTGSIQLTQLSGTYTLSLVPSGTAQGTMQMNMLFYNQLFP